jgi:hypothetical protein
MRFTSVRCRLGALLEVLDDESRVAQNQEQDAQVEQSAVVVKVGRTASAPVASGDH